MVNLTSKHFEIQSSVKGRNTNEAIFNAQCPCQEQTNKRKVTDSSCATPTHLN